MISEEIMESGKKIGVLVKDEVVKWFHASEQLICKNGN